MQNILYRILVILILIVGCTKSPTLVLEEKGHKQLTSQERLDIFCNGSYEIIYSWGKVDVKVDNCNYIWKNTSEGEEYEGILIESPPSQKCTLHNKVKGTLIDPPKKECENNHVTYKTGENEWKSFWNDKHDATILLKK